VKLLKNSVVNAIFIGLISAVYSFLFIFISNHIEFLSLLSQSKTLNSKFWNGWSNFIRAGNMKYIGYLIISLTIIIFLLIFLGDRKKYDEYQISILSKSLVLGAILSIIFMPIIMVMFLSDPNYSIETVALLAAGQWLSVLVSYLLYLLRY